MPKPEPYFYRLELVGSLAPEECQPFHTNMNWCEDLVDASGLDTSLDTGLLSPPNLALEEGASFAVVVRRAAEVPDLNLPLVAVKTNVMMEVHQPRESPSEPLLPFNKALSDILLGTSSKPKTGAPVNWTIAYRHCPASGDPKFLTEHPTP